MSYQIEYKGDVISLRKYCMLNNLPYKNIVTYAEMHKEIPIDDILKLYENESQYRRIIMVEGMNLKAYCKKIDVNYSTVCSYRRKYNMSVEEAIKYARKGARKTCYKSLCRKEGVLHLYQRIINHKNKYNVSIEEAIRRYKNVQDI